MYQVLKMERFQGSAAAVSVLGLVFAPATSHAQNTLKAAAAKANLYFGAAVGDGVLLEHDGELCHHSQERIQHGRLRE